MIRTLTITYNKSNEDVPVICVAESNLFFITIIKMFTGEKAEQLYKELTGQEEDYKNRVIDIDLNHESEDKV